MTAATAPVLIAGAGPAGLTAACTLTRHGVPCRVVDRRNSLTTAPKALVLWSGALEALRRTGVADEIVKQALPLAGAAYYARGRRLGRVTFGGLSGTAFPGPLCVPQPATEAALYDRLRELGGEVEWETEVTAVAASDTDVRVELHHDGQRDEITAPWVIGADGTHSRVRQSMDIDYRGRPYDRVFLLGDGRLTGPAPVDEAQYHLHPDGVLVVVPLPGGGHRVFFDVAEQGEEAPPDRALLQWLLDSRGRGGLHIDELWWTSRFRAQVRLAERFRVGRVFLVGDAAHCHSPAGGQGLNTGVQDGYDLGWKLAGVLRGVDESLLDTYEIERRPASARAVRNADRQTKLWMARSPVRRAIRDALMRRLFQRGVLERRMVPQLAQLDLDLSGSPAGVDLPGAVTPATVRLGRRIPDTSLTGGDRPTLHDQLAGGRHSLLVVGRSPAGRVAARAAEWAADRRTADVVEVIWLRPPGADGPDTTGPDRGDSAAPAGVTALAELPPGGLTDGEPWLAHVRPDGVVGARAGLGDLDRVLDRLPHRPWRAAG